MVQNKVARFYGPRVSYLFQFRYTTLL